MQAIAVRPAERRLELRSDFPRPRLQQPGDVLVRVLEVGVCGTDREICAFDYGVPPDGQDLLVIGHECLGEVVEVGSAVTRVRPGDLVVPTVRRPCHVPSCAACRQDQQDFCYTGEFQERGIKQQHGFMTELFVESERYLNVLPRALREVGVLVEPLTIAEKALLQVRSLQERLPWACPVTPGARSGHGCHKAVVLGAGPVGLLGAMALQLDCFETFVYSRGGDERRRQVEAIGATFLTAEDLPPHQLHEVVGQIDLIYEAMGASQASFLAMQSLGTNGVFVFTGVPGRKGPVAIDTDALMRNLVLKNQIVLGTVNAGTQAFAAAVEDLSRLQQRWPAALAGLISGRWPLQRYGELLQGPARGIKNVIALAS
jgi:threonine dehydrogenase-like Zn-dependent dehydrogenase